MKTPYQQLQEFLIGSYADQELRALACAALHEAPAISAGMPGSGASVSDLACALIVMIPRHFGGPPPSFWNYLYETRGLRLAEIQRLQAEFAPAVATAPTSEPSTVIHVDRGGFQDLLALAERARGGPAGDGANEATLLRGPLVDLAPGQVNGLARVFRLTTTHQHLEVHAMPSLYCQTERLAPVLRLPLPVEDQCYRYFPRGRGGQVPGQAAHVLRFVIERWDRGGGRVAFLAAPDHRWTIQFGL